MRATLHDVRKHPTWIREWWLDLPGRRGSWWRGLLFERGCGWLRWGMEGRIGQAYIDEGLYAPEPYTVAPPLRRFWLAVKYDVAVSPWLAFIGDIRWSEIGGGFADSRWLREDRKNYL